MLGGQGLEQPWVAPGCMHWPAVKGALGWIPQNHWESEEWVGARLGHGYLRNFGEGASSCGETPAGVCPAYLPQQQ